MSKHKKQRRGRPAALRVLTIEVRCQDCDARQPNPVTGSNEWSTSLYADYKKHARGRAACSSCCRTLELGGVVFDVIREPAEPTTPTTGTQQ